MGLGWRIHVYLKERFPRGDLRVVLLRALLHVFYIYTTVTISELHLQSCLAFRF